jgi:nucleoside-diphosphate-sugar epimerase
MARVLVTGLGGLIGRTLLEHANDGWELHGLSRTSRPGLAWHRADVGDLDAIAPAFEGDVFYAVSRNRWGYRDLAHAREVVGHEPRDAAEDHR